MGKSEILILTRCGLPTPVSKRKGKEKEASQTSSEGVILQGIVVWGVVCPLMEKCSIHI